MARRAEVARENRHHSPSCVRLVCRAEAGYRRASASYSSFFWKRGRSRSAC